MGAGAPLTGAPASNVSTEAEHPSAWSVPSGQLPGARGAQPKCQLVRTRLASRGRASKRRSGIEEVSLRVEIGVGNWSHLDALAQVGADGCE
jgi:hypothetical protein